MRETSCAAIILAAGSSSRLGRPKQLIRIAKESLVRRTVILAMEAGCSPIVVVLGWNAGQLESEIKGLDVQTARNEEWASGISSSIKCGLKRAVSLDPNCMSLLILVCDQIRLTLPILQKLLEKHHASGTAITACSYAGTKGVPAIFSQKVFPELEKLQGDEGARRIIAGYSGRVETVDFPHGDHDLDTMEDLALL